MAARKDAASVESEGRPPEPLSFLIVDDDEDDRIMVRLLLGQPRAGGEVVWVQRESLDDALAALRATSYDCALIDYRLPDGTAEDLVRTLRSEGTNDTPIVVLTGLDDESTAAKLMKLGVEDYLVKDEIDTNTLVKSIWYSIERHRIKTELEQARAQMERVSHLDALTEALNRRGLEHALHNELARATREDIELHAVLVDCDDFKSINERWGHAVGDEILSLVVKRVKEVQRGYDHIGRIGGDEFLMLLPRTTAEEALQVAERVRAAIVGRPHEVNGVPVRATVSMGVFRVPLTAHDTTDLLATGRASLQQSKIGGKDRISGEAKAA
jgi:diguanylate cyclase (GGDEF)-like protein